MKMKMKTSNLTGTALDWAVAKCEGKLNLDMGTCYGCSHLTEEGLSEGSKYRCTLGDLTWCTDFASDDPFGDGISVHYGIHQKCPLKNGIRTESYSTNWEKGGPIIECENIFIMKNRKNKWVSIIHRGNPLGVEGDTPLMAAMRCYVASKLGYDVEIPEELL